MLHGVFGEATCMSALLNDNNERLKNLKEEEQHFITNFRVVILAL
jgi:hypothetical protein